MSKVKYFYDLMSQPARAMWIALRMSKTPYEDCPIALRKREQLTDAYKKINRFQKVPAIVDGDFHLSESVAILRYLSDKGNISEDLYPKDLKKRARIDEFLEWQHMNVRMGCGMYFVNVWLLPINGLAPVPPEKKIQELRKTMENSLNILENIWLADNKFVSGGNLTIADVFGASEVMQTKLTKYDVGEKFPKIADWLQRVREGTNPHFDEAHKFLYKKSETPAKL